MNDAKRFKQLQRKARGMGFRVILMVGSEDTVADAATRYGGEVGEPDPPLAQSLDIVDAYLRGVSMGRWSR